MSDDDKKVVSIKSKKSPEINLQEAVDDCDASVSIIVGGEHEGLHVSGIPDYMTAIALLHDAMGIILDLDFEQEFGED